MGADVAVLDRNPEALRHVDAVLVNRVRTLFSTRDVVELLCQQADLVIATVLVPGSTTPKLITAQTAKAVKTGAMASFGTIEGPHPWLTASVQFSDFARCMTNRRIRRACPRAAPGSGFSGRAASRSAIARIALCNDASSARSTEMAPEFCSRATRAVITI